MTSPSDLEEKDQGSSGAERAALLPSEASCSAAQSGAGEGRVAASRAIYWRCFHCGDTFTRGQERWARQHFGRDEGELPVCQMRLPGEHHLLILLRKAQDELAAHYAEDTDLNRAIYAMAADHAAALRREEERGYEKGVADARAEASAANAGGER